MKVAPTVANPSARHIGRDREPALFLTGALRR